MGESSAINNRSEMAAGNSATQKATTGRIKLADSSLRTYTMVLALIAVWVIFAVTTDGIFLEARNFSNLMRQATITGVLAVGMLMVIIAGQIDLSIGSIVGLAGGAAAIAEAWLGWGLAPSIAIGVAV